VLTREGEAGREFVVLVEGTAEVTKNGRRVNVLNAGDFLGEIALISGGPRTATVTTTTDADLLVLTARSFQRVTKEMPSVQASVLKALSDRLAADTL
jgi:CRP-like cAMP-binding protein